MRLTEEHKQVIDRIVPVVRANRQHVVSRCGRQVPVSAPQWRQANRCLPENSKWSADHQAILLSTGW
jgi:hypothetical protein